IGAMCRFMCRVWSITGSRINKFNERDVRQRESIDSGKVIQFSVVTSRTLKLISEVFKDTHEFNIAIYHLFLLSSRLKKL
uniref:Uncharacterized protein n=1 Tax=Amphimedon queenslandica TaxID=400682 RepID=A0A1X7TQT4_AMPQE